MEKLQNKREKIMKTALRLILDNGYQDAAMSKISKESGVAIGTIYHYFSSKEELVSQMYKEIKLDMCKVLSGDGKIKYSEEQFEKVIKGYIDYALENKLEFEFAERYHNSPIIACDIRKEMKGKFEITNNKIFKELKKKNILREVPNDLVVTFLLGTLSSAIRGINNGDINGSKENIDKYLELILNGVIK